jgi:hypothetical protein
MFSKKSLRITLATVMLLGMVAMGLAYGAWSDSLVVDGSVQTGTLGVKFTAEQVSDSETTGMADIGDCDVVTDDTDHTLTFTMSNAYPGYSCKLIVNIDSTGSVPVKLNRIVGPTFTDGEGNSANPFVDFTYSGLNPGIPVGDGGVTGGSITIKAKELIADGADAEQGAYYEGTMTLDFVQAQ